jgi:hypothetical protein
MPRRKAATPTVTAAPHTYDANKHCAACPAGLFGCELCPAPDFGVDGCKCSVEGAHVMRALRFRNRRKRGAAQL